jgi:tRNA (cytidine/uridine-2'-O-)-methyltransferase
MLDIVLVYPQIPQNTGNIGRTCAATGCRLHLVEPLGFSLEDKYMKRAGLDYWDSIDITVHKSWEEFKAFIGTRPLYCFTTKGSVRYTEISLPLDAVLVFGSETQGLPPEIRGEGTPVRLPMRPNQRSLNLGNSVAVAVYEYLRQWGFPGLE